MLVNRLGFSVVNPDVPATSDGEVEWSAWIARQLGGVAEYVNGDGSRADAVTAEMAVEVEWAKNWKAGIGQALHYGLETSRKPVLVLLLRGHEHETRYIDPCRRVCDRCGIRLGLVLTVGGRATSVRDFALRAGELWSWSGDQPGVRSFRFCVV